MKDILEQLVKDGWTPATEFPDTDRLVQVAYDDRSTGPNAVGFVDEVSQIPPTGKRVWWEIGKYPPVYQSNCIVAWREIE